MKAIEISRLIREAREAPEHGLTRRLGKALEETLDERGDLMRQVQRLEAAFKKVRQSDPDLADELVDNFGLGEL